MSPNALWHPSPQSGMNLRAFQSNVAERHGCAVATFADLHRWSTTEPEAFWREVWDQCGAIGEPGDTQFDPGSHMAEAKFFPYGVLNYAENCLQTTGRNAAIIFRPEVGSDVFLNWDELHARVSCAQQALRDKGVGKGDRVAGLMPNIPATVIYMLATAALGAVWSSCSPDFGAGAVIDRFAQIAPKVLIAVDGYTYKGKPYQTGDLVDEVAGQLPSLGHILRVPYLQQGGGTNVELSEYTPMPIKFTRIGFNDPLFVVFSSGTSGVPKCFIHRAGGVVLQHLKEHQLHCDLRPDDRLFYFTTCGWMMWNCLVSGLASGATIVLFDGAPSYPDNDTLWQMSQDLGITHFGTSAKYIDGLRKAEWHGKARFDLSNLRMILSTGSVLSARNFEYVYGAIHDTAHLSSISGGTDILSCFLLGCPIP